MLSFAFQQKFMVISHHPNMILYNRKRHLIEVPFVSHRGADIESTPANSMILQAKIAHCVLTADTFHDLLKGGLHIGILTVFHPSAQKITQNAAKILVTGVTEKTAGIGEHADKIAQNSQICKGGQLLLHTGLVVVEPPGGAVLDFTGNGLILEAADQRAQLCVIHRIQRVQDRLGAQMRLIQCAQKL